MEKRQKVTLVNDREKHTRQYSDFDKWLMGIGKNNENNWVKPRYPSQLFVDVREDGLYFLNNDLNEIEHLSYEVIQYASISMCSRVGGLRYNRYQVDLDLTLETQTIYLEIAEPNSFQLIIDQLEENEIEIIDMVGVVGIYKQYPDRYQRMRYLDMHFNDFAKKHRLDHPRIDEEDGHGKTKSNDV